jgi:light-regulated signal transduction histidine kinase (bacteriophytochrome)
VVYSTPDLITCDQEPIHILGHIQSYGYLVAIRPDDYRIIHVSANIAELVGQAADSLPGKFIGQLLTGTDQPATILTSLLDQGKADQSWDTISPYRIELNKQVWNLILHEYGGLILLEWEPVGDATMLPFNQQLVSQALNEVQASQSLSALLSNTAQRIKEIIGFDRVMVYQFGADWHGVVVAEAKEPHLEPFLGLHYPASDIPRQARELYKKNLVRLIADVQSTPSPILTVGDWPADKPLDMTQAGLRAVSPVHIEYLKNMGVAASMSLSLMYRGELWGLISCHHDTARFVDYTVRQTARFVSQLLSSALEFRRGEENHLQRDRSREVSRLLHDQLVQQDNVTKALTTQPTTLLDLVEAGGAVLRFGGQFHQLGQTPSETEISALTDWLKTVDSEPVLQTAKLIDLYPQARDYTNVASGLLAITLSRELDEYVLWFRPEQVQQVTWAGNPEKPVSVDTDGQRRISPRQSFAAWAEIVRATADSWSETDVTSALKLREDILQVVNKQANEVRLLNHLLKEANDELDAFSYTVSHDLRTPLSSIRCYSEILIEEYGADFDEDARGLLQKIIDSSDRMRALIRHILYYSRMGRLEIKRQAVDMKDVLKQIREDVLLDERNRKLTVSIGRTPTIQGDSMMVQQVFQNLITNAAKYTRPAKDAQIQIEGEVTEEGTVYRVSDNGIGFDMKQADRMFDLFKRLENARAFEGTGVGLAVVKRIIDRHGGKIWFNSVPDTETTFWVLFPANAVASDD